MDEEEKQKQDTTIITTSEVIDGDSREHFIWGRIDDIAQRMMDPNAVIDLVHVSEFGGEAKAGPVFYQRSSSILSLRAGRKLVRS